VHEKTSGFYRTSAYFIAKVGARSASPFYVPCHSSFLSHSVLRAPPSREMPLLAALWDSDLSVSRVSLSTPFLFLPLLFRLTLLLLLRTSLVDSLSSFSFSSSFDPVPLTTYFPCRLC
jgi:hypothetical protein